MLPEVAETLAFLRSSGKKLFFLTNTSSRSQEQLQKKLVSLGVDARVDECYPSGVFAAEYIRQTHPTARSLYVVGGAGLIDELERKNFQCDGGPSEKSDIEEDELAELCDSVVKKGYDGVVVGFDMRFSFRKLAIVSSILASRTECFFYATNDDPYDVVRGHMIPGTGALLSALHFMVSHSAPSRNDREQPYSNRATILGKPNPEFVKYVAELHDVDLARSVFVGDRLDTDIVMGNRAGMQTLLVETGVHSREDIARCGVHPTWTLASFAGIMSSGKL